MLSSPMMTMEAMDQVITCMMGLLTMRTMLDITHYLIELERNVLQREDLTDQVMLSQDTDISVDPLEEEETWQLQLTLEDKFHITTQLRDVSLSLQNLPKRKRDKPDEELLRRRLVLMRLWIERPAKPRKPPPKRELMLRKSELPLSKRRDQSPQTVT